MHKRSRLRWGTLLSVVLLAPLVSCGGSDVLREPQEYTYKLEAKELTDLEVSVIGTANVCFGMTYRYTLSYPLCLGTVPAYCTDTYEVETQCVDGEVQVVRNDLISSDCDYTYDGTSCGPPPGRIDEPPLEG